MHVCRPAEVGCEPHPAEYFMNEFIHSDSGGTQAAAVNAVYSTTDFVRPSAAADKINFSTKIFCFKDSL